MQSALVRSIERHMAGESFVDTMRADETAVGRTVILPGDVDWLPAAEWSEDCVVSMSGRIVRLVVLHAINPGSGALTRLLLSLQNRGLAPHVIEPTREMAETLRRRGWRMKKKGLTYATRETWMEPR